MDEKNTKEMACLLIQQKLCLNLLKTEKYALLSMQAELYRL